MSNLEAKLNLLRSDFGSLVTKVNANKDSATNGIKLANDRIDRVNSRLSGLELVSDLLLAETKELYQLHNKQQSSLDSHSASIKQIYGLINDQGTVLGQHGNSINQLYQLRNEHQKILERHSESLNSAGEKLNELYRLNDDQGVVLGKHTNSINQLYQLRDEHQKILERHSESLNSAGTKISELYKLHDKQQESLDSHSVLLTSHGASILQLYQLHNAQQDSIDLLKAELVGVIAAIVKASSDNVGLWDAESYDGGSVGEKDGKAVRLFKNQFQGLKTHFAGIMKYYFNMDDPESSIYRLRYSIVAGFEETKDLLAEWFVTLLESQNTTNKLLLLVTEWLEMQHALLDKLHDDLIYVLTALNTVNTNLMTVNTNLGMVNSNLGEVNSNLGVISSQLNTTNTNLSTIITYLTLQEEHFKTAELYLQFIIGWLADIYEKIGSESNGDWIKELIKTLGEVLQTAIKTLGSLLETAIQEVGYLLSQVLDFLEGLLDDLVHLIVPENLDFIHEKFDDTGDTIKLKFPFVFGWIDSFKGLFGNQSKIEDQNFNLNGMFDGEVKLPFSKLNDFAPIIRGFATGFVLLGFLIDMYHWFHSRGEVVE